VCEWVSQWLDKRIRTPTTVKPRIKGRSGLRRGGFDEGVRPGICGISVLKREDGELSVIAGQTILERGLNQPERKTEDKAICPSVLEATYRSWRKRQLGGQKRVSGAVRGVKEGRAGLLTR
jgi:hypothetical protein